MLRMRCLVASLLAAAALGSLSGCAALHELQLHRLHRWNRNPDMWNNDAMFSVADPLPEGE